MSILEKKIPGFTLLEMLIVLSIIVILGAIGTGGLLEFRETMLIKENIEIIKQDVILAQQKAMLLEKNADEGWVFGIGIDFSKISNGEYTMFKWCSPYSDFEDGGEVTRSSLLAFNSGLNVGHYDSIIFRYNAVLPDADGYDELLYTNNDNCRTDFVGVSKITGYSSKKLHNVGEVSILENIGGTQVYYIVFEAVTGKAFLYGDTLYPINYDHDGSYKSSNQRVPLDILITRNRNPRFDLLSIYDSSGIMVHHVYNSDNPFPEGVTTPSPAEYIEVDGDLYERFTVADDIKSYRDYE